MRRASRKPRLTTSRVRSPLRSRRALVATVVPILTLSTPSTAAPGGMPRSSRMPLDRRVPVVFGVLGEELVGEEDAVGTAGDHVGEGSPPIDPELPTRPSVVHRALRPDAEWMRRGLSTEPRPNWHRCEPGGPGRPPAARSKWMRSHRYLWVYAILINLNTPFTRRPCHATHDNDDGSPQRCAL